VSSYVFMKVLERAPALYDRGMQLLSGGRLAAAHTAIAEAAARQDAALLDIGCGTAGVAIACAHRGARVSAIDASAGMLEQAQQRLTAAGLDAAVELHELGAAEIEDRWPAASFDAVVSCLALSEMAAHEQRYCLKIAHSRLRPGGILAVADEVRAPSGGARLWQVVSRAPVAALTRVLAQATSRPLEDLAALVRAAGFSVEQERRIGSSLSLVIARRPGEESSP